MMRIVVVGTSNSLMKHGYTVPFIASKAVQNFKKACMGKSVSLLASVTASDLDFSYYDYCLLDFAVNEHVFHGWGLSLDRIRDHVGSLAAQAWQAGCLPIVVLLPRKETRRDNAPIRRAYLDLASDLNLPFFDAIDIVEALEHAHHLTRDDMFRDGGHMMEWLAIGLGQKMLDGIQKLAPAPAIAEEWTAGCYRAIPLATAAAEGHRIVNRQNSLFSFALLSMAAGKPLQVNAADTGELVGICTNLGQTAGHLALRTGGPHTAPEIVDLRNGYRAGRQDFVMSTLPLPAPLPLTGAPIELTLLPPGTPGLQTLPKTAHILREAQDFADEGIMELHSLILRTGERTIRTKPAPALHVNLGKTSSNDAVLCAVNMFRSREAVFSR